MGGRIKSGRTRSVSILLAGSVVIAGCGGGSHFKDKPRPPVPVQLTGVVTDRGVQISPRRVGAGPVILIISNQTQDAHTITLEGNGRTDTVGPVNPLGTGKLQATLTRGNYTVKAGSRQATSQQIPSGTVTVTRERQSSSGNLELP
jgi:hypothetical protein